MVGPGAAGQNAPMAQPSTPVCVSRQIGAPAERVWALVTDLERMGEWSPENTGGAWVRGSSGPGPGARVKGTNRNGKRRWSTEVRVVTFEAPRSFEFDVTALGLAVARWGYAIEPAGDRCRVTETWVDRRGWLVRALGGPVSGVAERAAHNRQGMERTLAALAASAEGEGSPGAD